ncbi:MAG TPA: hypothetical protein PLL69_09620 [Gemmatimonadales bacterium]|nr:hypothetical protein [Gemmatimonadales bacterium]
MKTCQQCQEREAIVHLTLAGNGHSVTLHLCGECAADRGIKSELISWTVGKNLPGGVEELLAGWLEAELASALQCDNCLLTLAEYRVTRRLGCDQCWVAFDAALSELVRRFHGSRVHQGPAYLGPGQDHDPEFQLELRRARIRAQLDDAVAREAFEDAAVLRDALHDLGGPG